MKKVIVSFFILIICKLSLFASDFELATEALKSGDLIKANQLYTESCENKDVNSCFVLAVMYDNAEGVERDTFKAKSLYEIACEGNHAEACYNLGYIYMVGADEQFLIMQM